MVNEDLDKTQETAQGLNPESTPLSRWVSELKKGDFYRVRNQLDLEIERASESEKESLQKLKRSLSVDPVAWWVASICLVLFLIVAGLTLFHQTTPSPEKPIEQFFKKPASTPESSHGK